MGYPCKNGNFICSNKFLDSLKLPVFVLNKVFILDSLINLDFLKDSFIFDLLLDNFFLYVLILLNY